MEIFTYPMHLLLLLQELPSVRVRLLVVLDPARKSEVADNLKAADHILGLLDIPDPVDIHLHMRGVVDLVDNSVRHIAVVAVAADIHLEAVHRSNLLQIRVAVDRSLESIEALEVERGLVPVRKAAGNHLVADIVVGHTHPRTAVEVVVLGCTDLRTPRIRHLGMDKTCWRFLVKMSANDNLITENRSST